MQQLRLARRAGCITLFRLRADRIYVRAWEKRVQMSVTGCRVARRMSRFNAKISGAGSQNWRTELERDTFLNPRVCLWRAGALLCCSCRAPIHALAFICNAHDSFGSQMRHKEIIIVGLKRTVRVSGLNQFWPFVGLRGRWKIASFRWLLVNESSPTH